MMFFLPYVAFIYGASYSVQQVLEGLGVTSSNFITSDKLGNITGSYWSPSEALLVPFALLTIYFMFLTFFLLLASYTIGKWKGVIIYLCILITPGVLNLFGYWPIFNYFPETYVIGGHGELGSISGFIPLVIMGALTGWFLTIILYDNLKLGDKFRNIFDHFWYASALLAGVFFVLDSGVSKYAEALKEENVKGKQAVSYLLTQVKQYDDYCKSNSLESIPSCGWASIVQQKLNDYLIYNGAVFSHVGPKKTSDIYSPFGQPSKEETLMIRKEINDYNNQLCPFVVEGNVTYYSRVSSICQRPIVVCKAWPEELENIGEKRVNRGTSALASECLIPTIVLSRKHQSDLVEKVSQASVNKYLRWVYFFFFSFLVGVKVANATTKFFDFDSRKASERRRLVCIVQSIWSALVCLTSQVLKALKLTIIFFHVQFKPLFRKIYRKFKEVAKSRRRSS